MSLTEPTWQRTSPARDAGAKTTVASDVAEAVWLAATDESKRLRYPAGPDAEALAEMRRALPGDDYLDPMREAVGPKGST